MAKKQEDSILFAPAELIKKDIIKTLIISLIFSGGIFLIWWLTDGSLQNLPQINKKLPF
jgi:hypothetical protein